VQIQDFLTAGIQNIMVLIAKCDSHLQRGEVWASSLIFLLTATAFSFAQALRVVLKEGNTNHFGQQPL